MTRANYLRYMNKGDKVPDLTIPADIIPMVQYFNSIRGFAGVIDNPITMDMIESWGRHKGVTLERWERECVFAMDSALRRSYNDVVRYHSERKQIKTGKDKDWKRANG